MMFYRFRVNLALAELGVDHRKMGSDLRTHLQDLGRAAGCTPQDAAILFLDLAPRPFIQSILFPARITVAQWIKADKLSIANPAIQNSIRRLIEIWSDPL